MVENLLVGLNPVQQEIVKDTEGQFLTLAGAGSGKTRVLTHRAAYLLGVGVPAWQILAVTFTNKAAKEMRARLQLLAGDAANDVWIGTFHGVCIRILSRFGSEIGIEKFTILDDSEQKKILKEVMELIGGEYEIDTVQAFISNAKNALMFPSDLMEIAKFQHEKDVAQMYQAYNDKLRENNYLDYDDCIMETVRLFNVSEKALNHYSRQFRYVMTDETQDTNKAQFKLIQQLSSHHENVFAVGDSDQSIYKWRGAEISNIINFKNFFPKTRLYKLEQNYRSSGTIVAASNAVIVNNKIRLDKTAFTDAPMGDPIFMHAADDDGREADFICGAIKDAMSKPGRRYSDFAVLYRTNRQSRAVEVAMRQMGIPHQIVGGHAFYDRKEIKDLVAYLRVVNNGLDYLAFNRIINVPKRGIGDTSIQRIQAYANDCGIPFVRALDSVEDVPKVPKKAAAAIGEFMEMLRRLQAYSTSEEFTLAGLIQMIMRETAYKEMYNTDKEDDVSRLENIEELTNVADKWDKDFENEGKGLTEFLLETALVADVDSMEDDADTVTLMTVHSAKGLEFKNVFLIGLEEGIFPHGRSLKDEGELEEERRLMYVAMTRAEEKLFVSRCVQRYEHKVQKPVYNKPSRFLNEIPKQLVRNI